MHKTSEIRCHACDKRFTTFEFWRRHLAEVHNYVRRDPAKDEMKPTTPYMMRPHNLRKDDGKSETEKIAERVAKKVVQDYFYQLQSELGGFLQGYWNDSTPAVDKVYDAVSFTINNMGEPDVATDNG